MTVHSLGRGLLASCVTFVYVCPIALNGYKQQIRKMTPLRPKRNINEENMEKHRNRETRDSKLQFLCPSINFQKLLRFLDLLRRYARLGVAHATNDQAMVKEKNPGEFPALSSNLPAYSASAKFHVPNHICRRHLMYTIRFKH